jgi:hypothetical protein
MKGSLWSMLLIMATVSSLQAQHIGIGNNNPSYQLDINNRIRIRSGGNAFSSAGIWLNRTDNSRLAGFIGISPFGNIGFYSDFGAVWGLTQHATTGFIGIKNDNPHAPLQFDNTLANRKLVLYEGDNNDHQFYGLGIQSGELRYQVDNTNASHVFYAGTDEAGSAELMRIAGSGNVGIGMGNPQGRLQFGNEINNRILVLNQSAVNDHNFFGFGINNFTLRYQVADPQQSHVFFAGNNEGNASTELMRITGAGNVGIGTNNPTRPLSFPPLLGKKISLYPGGVGDAGLSVWGNELRIHSDNPNAAITFGVDAYANPQFTERMRITGAGNVGIGNSNPRAPLQFATDTRNRKIVLWSPFDNDHQFYGFGVNAFTLRYQTAGATDDHVFFAGSGENSSAELFRIKGNGGIGVNGNLGVTGDVFTSGGQGGKASWQSLSAVMPFHKRSVSVEPTATETQLDQLTINFTTTRNTRVLVWIDMVITGFFSCIVGPCPVSGSLLTRLNGGSGERSAYSTAFYPGGEFTEANSLRFREFTVAAGDHQFTVAGSKKLGGTYTTFIEVKMLLLSN